MKRTCPLCNGSYDDTLIDHFCHLKADAPDPSMRICLKCYESYPASTIHICPGERYKKPDPSMQICPKCYESYPASTIHICPGERYKKPDSSGDLNWLVWLVVILLALAFCGRQPSEQKPQQQPRQDQGFFNIPSGVGRESAYL